MHYDLTFPGRVLKIQYSFAYMEVCFSPLNDSSSPIGNRPTACFSGHRLLIFHTPCNSILLCVSPKTVIMLLHAIKRLGFCKYMVSVFF